MTVKMDGKFYGQLRKVKDDTVVPEDQWVAFLIKDNAFPATLKKYRDECARLGADAEQIAGVDRMIQRVGDWRRDNHSLCKVPDAAGEKMLG